MDATSWLKKNLINEGSSSTKYALYDQIELLQKGSSCGNHCFYNIVTPENAKSHCGSTAQQNVSELRTNTKYFLNQIKCYIQIPNGTCHALS